MANNQPIIFNIQYTPYRLPKNASNKDIAAHAEARSFYDLSGGNNLYKYITTKSKQEGEKTALEYLQKNSGVFNQNGLIPASEIKEMRKRAKANEGNIWHGCATRS